MTDSPRARRNAEAARGRCGRYPVMALQEFPRRSAQARAHELDARLREEFAAAAGWQWPSAVKSLSDNPYSNALNDICNRVYL